MIMQIRHILTLLALVAAPAPIWSQPPPVPVVAPAAGSADDKIPALLITGANNHDWKWTAPEK